MSCVDDIPIAHTPPGGHTTFPPPVLAGCTDPLPVGAPDLRGVWRVVEVVLDGGTVAEQHPALGRLQRVEQAGDRVVVTGGRVVHDMRCDGTLEHGVDDVAEIDVTTRIRVAASYEDGVHVLRPDGIPIEVKRWRDGEDMRWQYLGFTARLALVGPADLDAAAIDALA